MPSLHNTAASGSVKFKNIIRKFATENVIKLLGLTSCIEAAEVDFEVFSTAWKKEGGIYEKKWTRYDDPGLPFFHIA